MVSQVVRKAVDQFRAPKKLLGDLKAEAAASLIAAAADIALILDAHGIIRDVALGNDELSKENFVKWIGQHWRDTVTVESRSKIEDMIREASASALPRWRQVNHPSANGPDVPVRYSAVMIGDSGRIVAVGRDLRALSQLQQRLVEAQQSMERDYQRLRHAETRYRLLFQIASEAVLVVDSVSQKVIDANPAATELLGRTAKKMTGRPFVELFDDKGGKAITDHFATVRVAGRADEVVAKLADGSEAFKISASVFRQDATTHFLVRLAPKSANTSTELVARAKSRMFDVVDQMPDGFVVTDQNRRILTANQSFVDLTQAASEEQLKGENLDRWLGRHAVDVNVLMTNLREHGAVKNFATVIRSEFGTSEDVEISAVSVTTGEQPCIGITVRNVGRRPDSIINGRRALPRSVEQLTELVGRVSLKDLVRESTDMIERLCIEAALELTNDNRASAAEMLGLSRQGLYSKLRRYGLGDLDSD
jgi:transcriptional regulator PpsR